MDRAKPKPEFSDDDRRDEVLKRMLATPPKEKAESVGDTDEYKKHQSLVRAAQVKTAKRN